jgi:hypothetical protein
MYTAVPLVTSIDPMPRATGWSAASKPSISKNRPFFSLVNV